MMEKRRRIEATNGDLTFPKRIIQHIQSFMSGKDAAQTTVLSKSWYNAWSTRPNLDFNQEDFGSCVNDPGDEKGFWEFTQRAMQRYEELNLKIDSFRLLMRGRFCHDKVDYNSYSRAHDLIVKAVKMGATDLSFRLQITNPAFILPHEVLESENLIRLSVFGCKIDLGEDGKVRCSRLKSLNFRYVCVIGDIIWDIISICPLIEKLSLESCQFSSDLLELSPFVEFGKRNTGLVVDVPIKPFEFHKLHSLSLSDVNIHTLFFSNLSSKFPCLKDLSISHCGGFNYKEIKISSCSLECISFYHDRMLRAHFDVPSIRKFRLSGYNSHSLTFATTSVEWESDVSIICHRPSTLWFLKLNTLLSCLSQSKISVSLVLWSFVEKRVDFQSLPRILGTLVENLTIDNLKMHPPSSVCSASYALLECLFWCCRPKFVTMNRFLKPCRGGNANNKFLDILCTRLVEGKGDNFLIPNKYTFGLCDLEAVNVELFNVNLAEWQPMPLKTLMDALKSPKHEQKIQFQLR